MIKVTKLGFVGLRSVRVHEMKHYYSEVMGLPLNADAGSAAYLACGNEHHALALLPGDRPGIDHIGLQVTGVDSAQDMLGALKAQGVNAELQSDSVPGVPQLVRISDPDGAIIYLYLDIEPSRQPYADSGIRPDKIGHVAYFVADAERSAAFYSEVMGFKWSDWLERMFVFMRCNADHHTVNFLKSKQRGMFHVAFELHDWSHMVRACDVLAQHRLPIIWGPGRHGMGHNLFIYHHDPDGNVVEYIADLDRIADEELAQFEPRPYHQDNPQRPKVWKREATSSNMWGVPPPPNFGAQNVGEP